MFDERGFTAAMETSLPVLSWGSARPRLLRAIGELGSCGISADHSVGAAGTGEEFTVAFSGLADQALTGVLTNPHERASVLAAGRGGAANFRYPDQQPF